MFTQFLKCLRVVLYPSQYPRHEVIESTQWLRDWLSSTLADMKKQLEDKKAIIEGSLRDSSTED